MIREPVVIMNFSHVYEAENFYRDGRFRWVDCSDIPGTDCYCTPEAEAAIRERIRDLSPGGIHFLDSGNYHYASKLWMEKIREPFDLLVFDYHSDMQKPALADLMSCGCWIERALDTNPRLRRVWIVGPDADAFAHIDGCYRSRLVCVSLQSIRRHEARRVLEKQEGGNFYLSVDKDVLSRHFSLTNWNQGELSLETLERLASLITERGRVIGTDICGEPDPETVLLGRDGIDLNDTANRELLHFFLRLQRSGHSPRRRASGADAGQTGAS